MFVMADYIEYDESQQGHLKRDIAWQNVQSDNGQEGTWFGAFDMLGLFTRSDYVTGHSAQDTMPDGRYKLIHTVGAIAKAHIVWNDNGYTGMFQGANDILVRASIAAESDGSSITPAIALKAFRDGVPSGNLIFMYELDGQTSLNFFDNVLCNRVAQRPDLPLKLQLLGKKFALQSAYPGSLGISEFSTTTETGYPVANPLFPYSILLQPNPDVTAKMSGNTDANIGEALTTTLDGTEVIYKIYAVPEPGATELQYLGYIELETPFATSAYADLTLFFKHTFIEEDFALRPDWQTWFSDPDAKHWETEGRAVYEGYLPPF